MSKQGVKRGNSLTSINKNLKKMKKTLFTAVLALFSVVAFAQEKPQNTESKHVCTEQCDHGAMAKAEKKSCCSEEAGDAKACADNKETAMVAKKSCCSEKTTASASCADNKETARVAKKYCCSEKTTASASCADKPKQTAAAGENKSCCSKPAGAGTEK
jgi:hypothetical protein